MKKNKQTSYLPLSACADLSICTDAEKLDLLKRVRKNDKAAIEKMILSHIRLALSKVNCYVGVNHFINDLESAAMEGVVIAVNQIANGKMADHDNVTGYIVAYVRRYIHDAIRHNPVIYTPREQKDKLCHTLIESRYKKNRDPQLSIQEFELWDSVESLIENDLERKILKLRWSGYTDTEIGKRIKLSRP
ncbi:unnamed protein product, partial [marine sediment metagenome]